MRKSVVRSKHDDMAEVQCGSSDSARQQDGALGHTQLPTADERGKKAKVAGSKPTRVAPSGPPPPVKSDKATTKVDARVVGASFMRPTKASGEVRSLDEKPRDKDQTKARRLRART